MSDEKTEEPTEKKLDEAMEKGQSPKSPDVNAAASLLTGTILLSASSSLAGGHLKKVFEIVEQRIWTVPDANGAIAIMYEMLIECLIMCTPYLLVTAVVGAVAGFAQVGIIISFEPLMPNFDKLNPAEGIKKLFSLRSIIDFGKMLLKAIALSAVLYMTVHDLLPLMIGTALQDPHTVVEIAWKAIVKLSGAATLVFVVFGPLDFAIQKILFIRDQRMSKDDIKKEHKQSEGDPQLKGKRKQLAQEMINSPPQKRVPGSNVVVTNPTHYAVALKFKPGETALPIVVAKGMDEAAKVIRELADAHHVPIVSNPPLARALHKLELDEPIPEELFEAVAAVLRWVQTIDSLSAGLGAAKPKKE